MDVSIDQGNIGVNNEGSHRAWRYGKEYSQLMGALVSFVDQKGKTGISIVVGENIKLVDQNDDKSATSTVTFGEKSDQQRQHVLNELTQTISNLKDEGIPRDEPGKITAAEKGLKRLTAALKQADSTLDLEAVKAYLRENPISVEYLVRLGSGELTGDTLLTSYLRSKIVSVDLYRQSTAKAFTVLSQLIEPALILADPTFQKWPPDEQAMFLKVDFPKYDQIIETAIDRVQKSLGNLASLKTAIKSGKPDTVKNDALYTLLTADGFSTSILTANQRAILAQARSIVKPSIPHSILAMRGIKFTEVDTSKNGSLDRTEIDAWNKAHPDNQISPVLFTAIDNWMRAGNKGNGEISMDELARAAKVVQQYAKLTGMTPEEAADAYFNATGFHEEDFAALEGAHAQIINAIDAVHGKNPITADNLANILSQCGYSRDVITAIVNTLKTDDKITTDKVASCFLRVVEATRRNDTFYGADPLTRAYPTERYLTTGSIIAFLKGASIKDLLVKYKKDGEFKAISKPQNKERKKDCADRFINRFLTAKDPEAAEAFVAYFSNPDSDRYYIENYNGLPRLAEEIGKKYADKHEYPAALRMYEKMPNGDQKDGSLAKLAAKCLEKGRTQPIREYAITVLEMIDGNPMFIERDQNEILNLFNQLGLKIDSGNISAKQLIIKVKQILKKRADLWWIERDNVSVKRSNLGGHEIKLASTTKEAIAALAKPDATIESDADPYDKAYAHYVKGLLLYVIAVEKGTVTFKHNGGEVTLNKDELYDKAMWNLRTAWEICEDHIGKGKDHTLYIDLMRDSFGRMADILADVRFSAKNKNEGEKLVKKPARFLPEYNEKNEKEKGKISYRARGMQKGEKHPTGFKPYIGAKNVKDKYAEYLPKLSQTAARVAEEEDKSKPKSSDRTGGSNRPKKLTAEQRTEKERKLKRLESGLIGDKGVPPEKQNTKKIKELTRRIEKLKRELK